MLWGFRCVAHASYDLSIECLWDRIRSPFAHRHTLTRWLPVARLMRTPTQDAFARHACAAAIIWRCERAAAARGGVCRARWRGVLPWCARARCSAIDVSSLARRRRAAPDCAARARNCNIPGACASACARSNESARHHCRAPPCAAIEPRRRRWVHARRHPCRVRLSWPVCKIVKKKVIISSAFVRDACHPSSGRIPH
jgi:hypothetical protein